MTKLTERLIQVGAALAILFYGWQFAVQTVVAVYNGQAAQRGLLECQQQLAARPPLASEKK